MHWKFHYQNKKVTFIIKLKAGKILLLANSNEKLIFMFFRYGKKYSAVCLKYKLKRVLWTVILVDFTVAGWFLAESVCSMSENSSPQQQ